MTIIGSHSSEKRTKEMIARYLIYSMLTILTILSGCTEDNFCLSNQHAMQTGFYVSNSRVQKDTVLNRAVVFGLENDSILYQNAKVSKLFLPLSFDGTSTVFVLNDSVFSETIYIYHTKTLNYISRECGFIYDFKIDSISHTNVFIDSVEIFYPYVKYGENLENVKIYIR